MNDCLVTTLKKSVNDDLLEKEGALVFGVIPSTTTETMQDVLFTSPVAIQISVTGTVKLNMVSGGAEVDLTGSYTSPYAKVTGGEAGGTITIPNKYGLTTLYLVKNYYNVDLLNIVQYCPVTRLYSSGADVINDDFDEIFEAIPSTLTKVMLNIKKRDGQKVSHLSKLAAKTNLEYIQIVGNTYNTYTPTVENSDRYCKIAGDISCLASLTNLTTLTASFLPMLTGNIESLSTLVNLTSLQMRGIGWDNQTGIEGDLATLFDNMAENRTSGTLVTKFARSLRVTYRGNKNGTSGWDKTVTFTSDRETYPDGWYESNANGNPV